MYLFHAFFVNCEDAKNFTEERVWVSTVVVDVVWKDLEHGYKLVPSHGFNHVLAVMTEEEETT